MPSCWNAGINVNWYDVWLKFAITQNCRIRTSIKQETEIINQQAYFHTVFWKLIIKKTNFQ